MSENIKYEQHPIGKRIPKMSENEYIGLKSDISTNGYDEAYPIVLYEGMILDGWHRYKSATELKIEAPIIQYLDICKNNPKPLAFVWRSNRCRRHMSMSQLAAIAVDLLPDLEIEAKERMRYVGKHELYVDTEITSSFGENEGISATQKIEDQKNREKLIKGEAAEIAGDLLGVNRQYIYDVKKIKEERPEDFEKILSGEKTISELKKEKKSKELVETKKKVAKQSAQSISDNNKPIVSNTDYNIFLNTFNDNTVDCLLTDPPFSTDVKDINVFVQEWLPLALSKVKSNGRCYIFTGAYPIEIQAYLNILLKQTKFIVDNPLIWTYRNTLGITPKNKYNLNYQMIWHLYSKTSPILDTSITNEMFSVQDINAPDGRLGNRFHTWQKPTELAERLIRHGTKENDLVIDPFTCTGTFLIAAAKLNRKGKGCDISKENLDISVERGCVHV